MDAELVPDPRPHRHEGEPRQRLEVPLLSGGFKSSADRAGLKVSELNAEITVETAIVKANWRKNWPMMPVMNAHGMNTAERTRPIAITGAGDLLHRPDAGLLRGARPCSM